MKHEQLMAIALIAHDERSLFAVHRNGGVERIANTASIDCDFIELLSSAHAMYVMLDQFSQAHATLLHCIDAAQPVVNDGVAKQLLETMHESLTELNNAAMVAMRAAQIGVHNVANEIRAQDKLTKGDPQ